MVRFGRLTFLGQTTKVKSKIFYFVACECGFSGWKRKDHLVNGRTTSCGCAKREDSIARFTTHGYTSGGNRRTEYSIYQSFVARCTNRNHPAWKNYGGRGIGVCERWLESFENFISDMGERPHGLTLDRIDNDGHYGPDNCRWATWTTQRLNQRRHTHNPVAI